METTPATPYLPHPAPTMPYLGVIAHHDAIHYPTAIGLHLTRLCDTREECVAATWEMMLEELVGDMEAFHRYTLCEVSEELQCKIPAEGSDKNALKQLPLTEPDLLEILYAFFGQDHTYTVEFREVKH